MNKALHCQGVCQVAEGYGVGGQYECSPECIALVTMRRDFEAKCMTLMEVRRGMGSPIPGDNGCDVTPEALFWRKPNGEYGVQMFNAAWIGYQWGVEFQRAQR